MAEQSKKKHPLSLNQRHNRILLDLSASQPRHHPPEVVEPSTEHLEGRRRNTPNDDDIPGFSGFSDLDSPSPGEMKSSPAFELVGDGEGSSVDDKSGGSLKLKLQGGSETSSVDNYGDDVPQFSGIADFDDSPSPGISKKCVVFEAWRMAEF